MPGARKSSASAVPTTLLIMLYSSAIDRKVNRVESPAPAYWRPLERSPRAQGPYDPPTLFSDSLEGGAPGDELVEHGPERSLVEGIGRKQGVVFEVSH